MIVGASHTPNPETADMELAVSAATLWAMEPAGLECFIRELADDELEDDPALRRVAERLLDAVLTARAGLVPTVEQMRSVGFAVAELKGEDEHRPAAREW
jgi:hypothetical protein